MREDKDLQFLEKCHDCDLEVLVNILIKDTDGKNRYTEKLTSCEAYKEHAPQHSKYWKDIAREVQTFGGNTMVNIVRGTGVPYKEVLTDVCDYHKVKYDKNASTENIEQLFMLKIFESSLEQMTDEQRTDFLKDQGITSKGLTSPAIMTAVQLAIKGSSALSYKFSSVVANTVLKAMAQRGIIFGANATLARVATVATGPIGLAVSGVWSAYELGKPAYRVTVPAVIEIIYLRGKTKSMSHKIKSFFKVW